MPFSWKVNEHGVVAITFFGELDYRAVAGAMEHMLAGDRITPSSRVLANTSDATAWRISAADVHRLADALVYSYPGITAKALAFVAPEDRVYGDLRMWQALTGGAGCPKRVFRDEPSALRWLSGAFDGALSGLSGS